MNSSWQTWLAGCLAAGAVLAASSAMALYPNKPVRLIVPNDSPAKSVPELIALAKSRPGQLNYGSGGNGSQAHLAGAMFKSAAGVDIVHVPYKGAPEIVTSMLSGQTQLAFPTFSTALPQVKAAKLRGLAVTGAKRNPLLPDVPTLLEAMPNGFDIEAWFDV